MELKSKKMHTIIKKGTYSIIIALMTAILILIVLCVVINIICVDYAYGLFVAMATPSEGVRLCISNSGVVGDLSTISAIINPDTFFWEYMKQTKELQFTNYSITRFKQICSLYNNELYLNYLNDIYKDAKNNKQKLTTTLLINYCQGKISSQQEEYVKQMLLSKTIQIDEMILAMWIGIYNEKIINDNIVTKILNDTTYKNDIMYLDYLYFSYCLLKNIESEYAVKLKEEITDNKVVYDAERVYYYLSKYDTYVANLFIK